MLINTEVTYYYILGLGLVKYKCLLISASIISRFTRDGTVVDDLLPFTLYDFLEVGEYNAECVQTYIRNYYIFQVFINFIFVLK